MQAKICGESFYAHRIKLSPLKVSPYSLMNIQLVAICMDIDMFDFGHIDTN